MMKPFAQPTNVDHLPRENVHAFLADLAALAARRGIVHDLIRRPNRPGAAEGAW
jgi:hypothetical protein